jgi:calcineurin-like phosphoesterase family protein
MKMNNIFFTSDTHFGHKNIIEYSERPFRDVNEMDEAMINNWNNTVKSTDEVWHLGDFAFATDDRVVSIIKRLNGTINFIKGNHDKTTWRRRNLFNSAQDYREIDVGNQKIVMCHYPILSWNKAHRGSWMLHGHCHGSVNYANADTTRLDVGVDNFVYTPVSFEEVKVIMSKRTFKNVDHHTAEGRKM